jgi:hypothetical protein
MRVGATGFLMGSEARRIAIRIAGAVFGFAIVLSLQPLFELAATADQLPGYMAWSHHDAGGPFRFIAALMVVTILSAWCAGAAAPLFLARAPRRWSVVLLISGTLTSLWIATFLSDWKCVALPAVMALAVSLLFGRIDAGFSRRDLILLPTLIPIYLASLDLTRRIPDVALLVSAAALLLVIRLLFSALARPTSLPPALCFVASPLGIALQTVLSSRDSRHLGAPPLLLAVGAPVLIFLFVRGTKANIRRLLLLVSWVVYPLFAFCHPLAVSVWTAEGMQRSDIFERSHSILPASEMLRGERPYRDIVPGHGLLEDGLVDFLALRTGGRNLGDAMKAHTLVGNLNSIAMYAVGWAATGSPEAGIASFLLARSVVSSGTIFLRSAPALFSLALTVAAARLKRRRLLLWAGAVAGLGIFVGIEFAIYALATLGIAAVRFGPGWRERALALRLAAIGVVAGFLPPWIAMGLAGIALDFVRVTLNEVLTLAPAYNIGFFQAPAALATLRFFPEAMVALFSLDSLFYVTWVLSLLLAGVGLTGHRFAAVRRSEPLLLIALFSVLCAVSYAERHHVYNAFVAPALMTTVAFRSFRSRVAIFRIAGPLVVAVILMAAHVTAFFTITTMARTASGPLEGDLVRIDDVPRARGVFFKAADAQRIASIGRFVGSNLGPDETFFDFTNRGLTYYLFDRDCPVRQYEVAFYETPELQAEVIGRLERNRLVRAALVPDGLADSTVLDGIPMQMRAPLVWQYLQSHFVPAFQEGDVVFWRRR